MAVQEDSQQSQSAVHQESNPKPSKQIAVATDAFEKMNKRQQLALFAAAGLKAGPNISLAYAIEKFRREKIREILLYILFLCLFTISTLVQRDVTDAHYYTQTVNDVIIGANFPGVSWRKTFQNVAVDSDFWDYMTSVVPPLLYAEQWYNGQAFTTDELNYVLHVNRLVQAPRIRQLRVNREVCEVPPRLQNEIKYCYPAWTQDNENTTAIPGWPPGQLLQYSSAQKLQTGEYRNGLFPYGGGGFVIDIPLYFNQSQVNDLLMYLKSQKWTDLHTRAVFFDFALYNPINGLFLSVRLLFEFLPYGQVLPSYQFRAIRMGLSTFNDYAALLLDGCVYLMVLVYICSDVMKMMALGRNYFAHFWHWFNWANYIVFIITLSYKIMFLVTSYNYVEGNGDLDLQNASLDFESLGWTYYQIVNWNAFNNIFVWLRAFAFLKYVSKEVANLSYTLTRAGKDCALFLIIFCFVLFAYAQAFHISFGTDISDYSTLLNAIFGLFKTLLGDFDFEAIQEVNQILGPLLFITFEVVCYFVMLNMFLAILNKAYSDVMDKGVDDPMAVEFRATMEAYVARFLQFFAFWKSKTSDVGAGIDDDAEQLDEGRKGDVDEEALQTMLSTMRQLSMTVKGLSEKVEAISKSQAMLGPAAKLQTLGRTIIDTGGSGGSPAAAAVAAAAMAAGSSDSQSLVRVPSKLAAADQDRPLELQEILSEEEGPAGQGDTATSRIKPTAGPAANPVGGKDSAAAASTEERVAAQKVAREGSTRAGKARYGPPVGLPSALGVKVGDGYVLPPGWKQFAAEDGKPYFLNTATRKTQWDPPAVTRTPMPRLRGPGSAEGGDSDDADAPTPRMQ